MIDIAVFFVHHSYSKEGYWLPYICMREEAGLGVYIGENEGIAEKVAGLGVYIGGNEGISEKVAGLSVYIGGKEGDFEKEAHLEVYISQSSLQQTSALDTR